MTTTVSTEIRDTRVEYTYDVSGAPAHMLRYRLTKFLPTAAQITIQDGRWYQIRIQGANVKKDGSPGVGLHYDSFYRDFDDDLPEWAAALAMEAERRYAAMAEAVAS